MSRCKWLKQVTMCRWYTAHRSQIRLQTHTRWTCRGPLSSVLGQCPTQLSNEMIVGKLATVRSSLSAQKGRRDRVPANGSILRADFSKAFSCCRRVCLDFRDPPKWLRFSVLFGVPLNHQKRSTKNRRTHMSQSIIPTHKRVLHRQITVNLMVANATRHFPVAIAQLCDAAIMTKIAAVSSYMTVAARAVGSAPGGL